MPKPTLIPRAYEADVIAGLEPFAADEIRRLGSHIKDARDGVVRFDFVGEPKRLLGLRAVLSVYRVQHFAVPRPKALLGDQHLRALLAQVDTALSAAPRSAFRTFMLGAAGADSAVMQRIKEEIATHTHLTEVQDEGDLLVRLLPSPAGRGVGGEGGWNALVRIGPKPLGARQWRTCVVEGALQATVAHVMVMFTKPQANDVYLNLCCGSGTLLLERTLHGKAARLIGCDTDLNALACATRNMKASGQHIELNMWDAAQVPLADASVDAITADLPFGLRVGSHAANEMLYPAVLHEAARIAKPRVRFVIISAEVKLLTREIDESPQWSLVQSVRVDLGGLHPMLAVLERTPAR